MKGSEWFQRVVRSARRWFVVVVALAAFGCGGGPSPQLVPVGGPAAALDSLAGEWTGEYWSADTGRSGSIHFRLEADDSAAWGDVTMFPGSSRPDAAAAREPTTARRGARTLTIRFVRVEDGQVAGTLDPYEDPVCGCMLSTVFTGVVAADHVEGSFVARGPSGRLDSAGRWRVERVVQRP
jgi:hypothetical protein